MTLTRNVAVLLAAVVAKTFRPAVSTCCLDLCVSVMVINRSDTVVG